MSSNHYTRITIMDSVEGISIATDPTLVLALVAALATDPTSIEGLLRAADAIYSGASRVIMGSLIAHDRRELLRRRGYQVAPVEDVAWPITSRSSFERAQQPASGGLLWLDLVGRTVCYRALLSDVEPAGEVPIFDGYRYLPRTVTYDLRGRWKIIALD